VERIFAYHDGSLKEKTERRQWGGKKKKPFRRLALKNGPPKTGKRKKRHRGGKEKKAVELPIRTTAGAAKRRSRSVVGEKTGKKGTHLFLWMERFIMVKREHNGEGGGNFQGGKEKGKGSAKEDTKT